MPFLHFNVGLLLKVNLSLYFIKHYVMKTYESMNALQIHSKWRLVVSFMLRPLYSREGSGDIHCVGGWVGPRAGLDDMKRENISCRYRESNPDISVVQTVA
jgi:hypothetical protein